VSVPLSGREFEVIADHAGSAYLRYSFTKGTDQEAAFLVETLGLESGMRVLDVGCGPGRHLRALRRLGIDAVGVDISATFLRDAGAPCARADARRLPFPADSFDAAVSLCQGGFGLLGGHDDGAVLVELAQVVAPGGLVALSAFSAYFALRYLEDGEIFDAATGVQHEVVTVQGEDGSSGEFDLSTTCFTPRELRLLAERAGLAVRELWSVSPGDYQARPADIDHPEFLVVAAAPTGTVSGPV
jgi:SAM-dependent methyltransferase